MIAWIHFPGRPRYGMGASTYDEACQDAMKSAESAAAPGSVPEGTTVTGGRHQEWTYASGWLRTKRKGSRIRLTPEEVADRAARAAAEKRQAEQRAAAAEELDAFSALEGA